MLRQIRPPSCTWAALRMQGHPAAPIRRIIHCQAAKKGFGSGTKPKREDREPAAGKGKRVRQPQQPQQPYGAVPPSGLDGTLQRAADIEQRARDAAEDAEFMGRLAALKTTGRERAREVAPASAGAKAAAAPAAFDVAPVTPEAVPLDIYANPPSLADTFLNQINSEISDPALRNAKIGPGQLGVALGAIVLAAAFLVVAGGDFATTKRFKGITPKQPPPDEMTAGLLAGRAAALEGRLEDNPGDLGAVEALAVTYAKLYQFDKALPLLDKLTAARPQDVEAWRLLGEAALLRGETARSVAAFERATALRDDDLQITTGMTNAYVANSQQAKAVAFLNGLRAKARAAAAAPAPVAAAPAPAAGSAAGADASSPSAPAEGVGSAAARAGDATSSGATGPSRPLDAVSVDLLLGKAYAAWRGHDSDALAAYDRLTSEQPTDFRGYLAKGVFLKERGRKADAERMFLQAKFYAPASLQAFVASKAGEVPQLAGELPDNGLE